MTSSAAHSGTVPRPSAYDVASCLLVWMLLCLGCGGRLEPEVSTDLEHVQLQLNWLPDAQHGGFYDAVVNGHYRSEGLEVEIIPGGPGTAVIPKVAMGRCDFAVANADQVLLARAQQADVMAAFAAMQHSPRCIIVHEQSGISSLHELEDITLALGDGKAFAEYLKRRVPLKNVRIVSYSGTVAKFLIDENFAQQGYVFSEPVMAREHGGDPRSLMVSDLGFNPYSSVVVTRRGLWRDDADLVRRFVRATRAGWLSYLQAPETANLAIVAANPEMTAGMLAKSAVVIRDLCRPPGFEAAIGSMELHRWDTLRDQLIELGLLDSASPSAESAVITDG